MICSGTNDTELINKPTIPIDNPEIKVVYSGKEKGDVLQDKAKEENSQINLSSISRANAPIDFLILS